MGSADFWAFDRMRRGPLREECETIEEVIEPDLIQQSYLQRTQRGRIATLAAYRRLGVAPPSRGVEMFGV